MERKIKYKKIIKRALSYVGVEIKRIGSTIETPTFFNDHKEALLFNQGGKSSAFLCPIEKCTHYIGLGFSQSHWHPFVETINEYKANPSLTYGTSILKKYYDNWTPTTAAEAIAGFHCCPAVFANLLPHHLFLSPWAALNQSDVDIDVRWWNLKDNTEHGRSDLHYPEHGWAFFGPTHHDKGELEFKRLIKLYKSLSENGYDHSKGCVGVSVLKRGDEYMYLVGGGGYHRIAVMAALEFETVPAKFHRNSIIDVEDVSIWPNVRNGIWTEQQARNYVDHLFTFDSRKWAKDMNFLNAVN
jgi:hypothetical protein